MYVPKYCTAHYERLHFTSYCLNDDDDDGKAIMWFYTVVV